eukprot:15356363-Heterocapsa_arctica.AAC.1
MQRFAGDVVAQIHVGARGDASCDWMVGLPLDEIAEIKHQLQRYAQFIITHGRRPFLLRFEGYEGHDGVSE